MSAVSKVSTVNQVLLYGLLTKNKFPSRINPLIISPNIHIPILQTDLYTFPLRISKENLIKDQSIFSLVITSLILLSLSLDKLWISLGEN